MDVVKFIEERKRMCESFGNRCTGCPAYNVCADGHCCAVDLESTLDAMTQVAIVEGWSATHPRKARQSEFLKQYPETTLDAFGVIQFCPMAISATHRGRDGECKDSEKLCIDCRREFWKQEVE